MNLLRAGLITLAFRAAVLSGKFAFLLLIGYFFGPAGHGSYSLLLSILFIGFTFSRTGVEFSSVVFVSNKQYDSQDVIMTSLIVGFVTSAAVSTLMFFVFIFLQSEPYAGFQKLGVFLVIPIIIFTLVRVHVRNLLLGMSRVSEAGIIGLLQTLITIPLILLPPAREHGLNAVVCIYGLGMIADILYGFYVLLREGLLRGSFRISLAKAMIMRGIPITLGNAATSLLLRADILMLSLAVSPVTLGLYSFAVLMAEKVQVVGESLQPLFIRWQAQAGIAPIDFLRRAAPVLLFIFASVSVLILLLLHFLLSTFFVAFSGSLTLAYILIPASVFYGFFLLFDSMAIALNIQKLTLRYKAASLILNIALNAILIPLFSAFGAAIASLLAYFALAFLCGRAIFVSTPQRLAVS